jgi:hypothetical protein
MRATAYCLPGDPVIEMPGPLRDFAITLSDGRRVIGHDHDGEWSISVYAGDQEARLIGYGSARTRPHALEQAWPVRRGRRRGARPRRDLSIPVRLDSG